MPSNSKTDEVLDVMANDTKTAPSLPGFTNEVIVFEPMAVPDLYGAAPVDVLAEPSPPETWTCSGCGYEIDPDCCWCGTSEKLHDPWVEGHSFVSMGCTCGFKAREAIPEPEEPVAEWDIL